jgi:DeoR/GlpR family transcriptional regulator of sugar metabolism
MLARQRQEQILDHVRRTGGVRVSALVQALGVSDMTVRRDIGLLAERGLLVRVHGGATLAGAPHSSFEPQFATKAGEQRREKGAIADVAAGLVAPGASVAISGGTTTLEVARRLQHLPDLTVVTNSLPVAEALHDPSRRDRIVILTGGTRTPSDALVGPLTVAALRDLHVDLLFLGVHGFGPRTGCTSPSIAEATTNRALIAAAGQTVVVADHTKYGLIGLATVVPLEDVDVFVTDDGLGEDERTATGSLVGRLVVAPRPLTDDAGAESPADEGPVAG